MTNANRSLKVLFGSLAFGILFGLIFEICLFFFIRRLGLAWRGNIFGNETFNWYDAVFVFLAVGGCLLGVGVSKFYLERAERKRSRSD